MKKIKRGLFTIAAALGADILWLTFIILLFTWMGSYDVVVRHINDHISFVNSFSREDFFFSCVSAPIWEEIVFRVFPLSIILALPKELSKKLLIPTVLCTSAIFGLAHGAIINIWIQGVGGVMLSWIYIRTRNPLWNISYHALWNFLCLLGICVFN